jgi:bacteriocin-like protein
MTPATNTIRELTEAKLDLSNELRDEELEQVIGGSITRKIDKSSPVFFQNACSGTAF